MGGEAEGEQARDRERERERESERARERESERARERESRYLRLSSFVSTGDCGIAPESLTLENCKNTNQTLAAHLWQEEEKRHWLAEIQQLLYRHTAGFSRS